MKTKSSIIIILLEIFYLNINGQLTEPVNYITLPAISTATIAIDGIADEADWSADIAVSELFNSPSDFGGESDLSGKFNVCWNYVGIYVFTYVTDDSAHVYSGQGNDYQFDNIELFFNWDTTGVGTGITTYAPDGIQLRFNRGYNDGNGALAWGSGETGKASGYDATPVSYKTVDYSTYWVTEIFVPWLYILPSGTLAENLRDSVDRHKAVMGFDLSIADSDGTDPSNGARDAQLAWDADMEGSDMDEDNAWRNTTKFGLITLAGIPYWGQISESENKIINFFPNPANKRLEFKGLTEISKIELISFLGQVITRINVSESDISMDISELTPGSYFLKFYTENNVYIDQFVKY